MKLLRIKILVTLKLVLLFNLFGWSLFANTIVYDRLLLKVMDQVYSLQDFKYQLRNLKTLNCVFPDSITVRYFTPAFLESFSNFLQDYPSTSDKIQTYYMDKELLLRKLRLFFKGIKYSEDQKLTVSDEVEGLIRESTKINKCDPDILKTNGLKANFLSLLRLELYLRSRYVDSSTNSKEEILKY